MVRLSHNEINDMIEAEENGTEIPEDAHSIFRFEIKETSADLLKQMKELPRKHYPQKRRIDQDGNVSVPKTRSVSPWEYRETEAGIHLQDPDFYSYATVTKTDEGIEISTALSGFKYQIKDNKDKPGASVEFDGPLNGLLQQNLLPRMTYVPKTLEAKFVDAKTQEDITPYMDINIYGELRKEKNRKRAAKEGVVIRGEADEKFSGNEQDYFGYNINMMFNNELTFLSSHMTTQEYKNNKAQRLFGHKKDIYEYWGNKNNIKKRIEAARASKEKVSGVVEADKRAEKKIKETKIPVSTIITKGLER